MQMRWGPVIGAMAMTALAVVMVAPVLTGSAKMPGAPPGMATHTGLLVTDVAKTEGVPQQFEQVGVADISGDYIGGPMTSLAAACEPAAALDGSATHYLTRGIGRASPTVAFDQASFDGEFVHSARGDTRASPTAGAAGTQIAYSAKTTTALATG